MTKLLSIDKNNVRLLDTLSQAGNDLSITEQFLVSIYSSIVSSRQSSPIQSIVNNLLEIGCNFWGAKNSAVIEPISSSIFKVIYCYAQDEDIYIGKHLNSANSAVLLSVMKADLTDDGAISIKVIKESNYSLIGAKFGSTRHKDYVLYFENLAVEDDLDAAIHFLHIQLLAEGVAFMVDQSNVIALHKEHDQEISAKGTVRSLEEYTLQAKIPEMYGVPARVLDSLERRIGEMPLSISDVANDLNLSKRTLQRRLQQQDVNFADLRDNVRFHYSIDYLLKGHQSIDGISTLLDFSDRTSFTNAFKRWTGLSPSNFRKLFRDYV